MSNKDLELAPSQGGSGAPGVNETALRHAGSPQAIPALMTGAQPVPAALQRLASRIAGTTGSNSTKFLP